MLVVPVACAANVRLVADSVAAAGLLVGVPLLPLSKLVVLWQPLQSCPAWWLAPSLVLIRTPYQLMPNSWQLMQVFAATGVWFIVVPPKVAKFDGEWQLSHAVAAVGMCVAGGAFGTMFAKLRPVPWHVAQPEVMPVWFIV